MLESQHSHHNQMHSHILHLPIDLVCPVPTSLRMPRGLDHPAHHEMYHDNTPPTTHKRTTMLRFELLLQHCCLLEQQQREACQREINLRQ